MNRKDTWRADLTLFVKSCRKAPYRPGVNDCVTFCSGAIKAMTGHDFFASAPKYETVEEGLANLRALGYQDHVDFLSTILPPAERHEVKPGDLAVLPGESNRCLGVVQGEFVYALGVDALGRTALGVVPIEKAEGFFKV